MTIVPKMAPEHSIEGVTSYTYNMVELLSIANYVPPSLALLALRNA
jgi:hypothetical protein